MEKDTALAIFNALEEQTYSWVLRDEMDEPDRVVHNPTYNVRLDAGTTNSTDRFYTLFIRIDANAQVAEEVDARDALLYVLELCREHGVEPELQNAGIQVS